MNLKAIGLSCFTRTGCCNFWLRLSFSLVDVIHEFKIATFFFPWKLRLSRPCQQICSWKRGCAGKRRRHYCSVTFLTLIAGIARGVLRLTDKASPDFHSSYFVASHDELVVAVEAGSSSQSQWEERGKKCNWVWKVKHDKNEIKQELDAAGVSMTTISIIKVTDRSQSNGVNLNTASWLTLKAHPGVASPVGGGCDIQLHSGNLPVTGAMFGLRSEIAAVALRALKLKQWFLHPNAASWLNLPSLVLTSSLAHRTPAPLTANLFF